MFTPEKLENRRLLSVAVKFDPASGQLDVYGIGKENEIRVTMVNTKGTTMSGTPGGAGPTLARRPGPIIDGVSVYDGTRLVFNSLQKRVNVQNVDVLGDEGIDRVTIMAWNTAITSNVFGNAGPDTVYATANNASLTRVSGGGDNDLINLVYSDRALFQGPDAGAGDDVINVFGGLLYDTELGTPSNVGCDLRGRLIYGGDGNDVISASIDFAPLGSFGYLVMGGSGDDVITGSAYADQLYGDDGNDDIDAGAGDDYLNGGLGDDRICGEDGNDFLDHGGGTDMVDGGNGFDTGIAGKEDELIDIEELI